MGPERLQLEPLPETDPITRRMNGLIRYAAMNEMLGKVSAQRILDFNTEYNLSVIDEDILQALPYLRQPSHPIAQGLRQSNDFEIGQGIYLLADNYETFHFCQITDIAEDRLVAQASKHVNVYIPPDFIGLLSEDDYHQFVAHQQEPGDEKPPIFNINLEITRLVSLIRYQTRPSDALMRRLRYHFNLRNTWFYRLRAEDLMIDRSQIDTISADTVKTENDKT